MISPGRRFAAIGVALALVGAVGWYGWKTWRAYEKSLKGLVGVRVEQGVGLAAREVTLTQGEGGRAVWKLVAESAQYKTEAGVAEVDNPVITYFPPAREGDGGEQPSQTPLIVRAPKGSVDRARDEARLWPKVEGEQGETRLFGEALTYAGADKLAVLTGGAGPVRVEREGMRVEAPRVEISVRDRTVTALGGVTTILPAGALNAADKAARSSAQ